MHEIRSVAILGAGAMGAAYASMFQDMEAGRKTEVELFAGKVVDLGEKYGVPTPVNRTLLHIIQVLEKYPG